jgi:methyl-accepting chemotaxis protein
MRLKYKILSGFIILSVMLIIAGIISIFELTYIGQSVQDLLDDNYKSIDASNTMLEALEREDNGILLLILGKWEEGRKTIQQADSMFNAGYHMAKNNLTIPNEDTYIKDIDFKYKAFKNKWIKPIVGTKKEGDLEWYYQNHHQAFNEVKIAVKNLMELNQKTIYNTGSELKERAKRAVMPGIIAIIAAIVFSLIFSYFIHYYVIKPLMKIAEAINDYNDYNKPFNVEVETNDEIKDISQALHRLLIKKFQDH